MKRLLLLCLMAFLPVIAQAQNISTSKAEQEALTAVDEVLQALVKRDATALERYLTEDHFTVYDAGQVGDRKLLIDSLKITNSGWETFERLKSQVKFAGNAALVLCETKAKRFSPRGKTDLHWQTTVTLVRENKQWRVASAQFTLIKPPAPAPAQ